MAEILAVVTIMGIIAVIVVPRFAGRGDDAKARACEVNKGNIEIQAALWFRDKGSAPAANLNDIGADTEYFTEGVPTCPVDGSSYTIDQTTRQVIGHQH